jgi:hypothetical protein
MAIRLSIAFNTSAESWLNQQLQYDLWHAEKRPEAAPRGEKPTVHEKADALRAETSRIGPPTDPWLRAGHIFGQYVPILMVIARHERTRLQTFYLNSMHRNP